MALSLPPICWHYRHSLGSGALNLSLHDHAASTYSLAQPATTILFKNTAITSCMQFYIILLTISFKFLLKAELLASTILKVRCNSPLSGRSMIYIIILLLIFITIVNYVLVRMYCFSGFCLLVSSIFMISRVELHIVP